MADMGRFNEELALAGVLLAADGMHPSARGARIAYDGDRRTVADGPFTDTRKLVAGDAMTQQLRERETLPARSRACGA